VLDLPYNSTKGITRRINKKLMKDCWIRDGVLISEGYLAKSLNDAKISIKKLVLPVIVKPVDSCGS
jgi:glutathione synthase/RimK-type ligase-like ATP-grasp enzyme